MSRDEIIKELLETKDTSELVERIDRLEEKIDLMLSCMVMRQNDACDVAGVTPETVRNKVLRGETEVLSADGSRLNYITLEKVIGLKKRKPTRRK